MTNASKPEKHTHNNSNARSGITDNKGNVEGRDDSFGWWHWDRNDFACDIVDLFAGVGFTSPYFTILAKLLQV